MVRLPSKPGDWAIDDARSRVVGNVVGGENDVWMAENSKRLVVRGVRSLVCAYRVIRDLFDQARAKQRTGDTEDHVMFCKLRREIHLRDRTARRVRAIGDGQQGVDGAIRLAIGISHETRHPYRPVR